MAGVEVPVASFSTASRIERNALTRAALKYSPQAAVVMKTAMVGITSDKMAVAKNDGACCIPTPSSTKIPVIPSCIIVRCACIASITSVRNALYSSNATVSQAVDAGAGVDMNAPAVRMICYGFSTLDIQGAYIFGDAGASDWVGHDRKLTGFVDRTAGAEHAQPACDRP